MRRWTRSGGPCLTELKSRSSLESRANCDKRNPSTPELSVYSCSEHSFPKHSCGLADASRVARIALTAMARIDLFQLGNCAVLNSHGVMGRSTIIFVLLGNTNDNR